MKKIILSSVFILSYFFMCLCRAQLPAFTLYGMTIQGGNYQYGTLFQWPIGGGLFQSDHDFGNSGDGASPWGSLVLANNGLLYGMTKSGGTGLGTIFSFNPANNAEVVYHKFRTGGDGVAPFGSLIQAHNGLLYGLTASGGTGGVGAIISFNTVTDSEQVIYSFNSGTGDGQYPYGSLIQANDSLLYGMTQRGGLNDSGVIFSFNISSGIEVKLHDFGNGNDAAYPSGSLMQASDSLLYGMSYSGGSNNLGALFSYNISTGNDSVLHSFSNDTADGRLPFGSLIQANNGLLYGLTEVGGKQIGGTMFSYNIATGALSVLHNFGSIPQDGLRPEGTLMQATDGKLYGMTTAGGSGFDGILFSYTPTDSTYTTLAFTGFNGYLPYYGALIEVENYTVPVLVQSPAGLTICANDSASFTATATGSAIAEQWQVSTDSGSSFTNIAGAVDTTYTFVATSAQNGYLYRAIISNPAGADTTAAAALQVPIVSTVASAAGPVCTASQTGGSYQWIDCSTGSRIGGATSQTYTAIADGSYGCIVTYHNCTDTTNCLAVTVSDISTPTHNHFNIYPNPNTGNFVINSDYPALLHVRIISSIGSLVKEEILNGPGAQFDISDAAAGIYQVMILDGRQLLKVVKVTKQ